MWRRRPTAGASPTALPAPSALLPLPPPPQVLLDVHNTHRYLSFFAAIRAAIASGTFPSYRHWFLQRRQRWLVGGGPSAAAAGAEAAGAES